MATVRNSKNCRRASVRTANPYIDPVWFSVVFRLKTWTRQEGAVRLSEDDGPPAHSFLGDDEELEDEFGGDYEDNDSGNRRESRPFVPPVGLQSFARTPLEVTSLENAPPVPPPKDRT